MGRAGLARLRGEWRGADPRCSVEAPEARSMATNLLSGLPLAQKLVCNQRRPIGRFVLMERRAQRR
jgi:hypothetical protein